MRILVLGGGGFIGRHILAELIGHGHGVVAAARPGSGAPRLAAAFPGTEVAGLDLARMLAAEDWAPRLAGIDVVVNAAGVLRGPDLDAVHVAMPRALAAAAGRAGVRRLVLVSAISARADVATAYARTKLEGEAALRGSGVGCVVLRPSLVYAEGSYGGTSLLRGLAGLPWLVPVPAPARVPGAFPFTPIHAADLARAVRLACEETRLEGMTLEPCGPETLGLAELLARYRAWLGFGALRTLPVPMDLMRLLGRLGDLAGDGPVSTTSLDQMTASNAGDGDAFAATIGFRPRSLGAALAAHPAGVQDRWHARLFFLAPAVRAGLVVLWLASAALGVATGAGRTAELVARLGLPAALGDPLRLGSSAMDVAIAGLVLLDPAGRRSTPVQILVVLGYTLVLGLALPGLWLDPLGPLLKNLPVLLLVLVHGAIADRR